MRLKSLVGEFEYRFDGPVQITMDPSWIAANIVRHEFPIVGAMWCNRHAIPGIHAALAEAYTATGELDKAAASLERAARFSSDDEKKRFQKLLAELETGRS